VYVQFLRPGAGKGMFLSKVGLIEVGAPICAVTVIPSILWLRRTVAEDNKMLQRGHPPFEECESNWGPDSRCSKP
jgi:hypothetical protein